MSRPFLRIVVRLYLIEERVNGLNRSRLVLDLWCRYLPTTSSILEHFANFLLQVRKCFLLPGILRIYLKYDKIDYFRVL